MKAYAHQQAMADFAATNELVLNTSDPGTGKTRGTLMGFEERHKQLQARRLLVVAPLSILRPSWGDDIERFTAFRYAIAMQPAKKRLQAFESDADIVMINHDGVNWLSKHLDLLDGFTDLVIDEFTAFKNRTAQRSKAMLKVSKHFQHKTLLSGTPIPNTVLDLWHPMLILDEGQRLGRKFFEYRSQVCVPESIGYQDHVRWVDKPHAPAAVADAVSDLSIRFAFEDCVDIPSTRVSHLLVDMPKQVMDAYLEMESDSTLRNQKGEISLSAVHAGARVKKMLQILSGSVYDESGKPVHVHNDRYELVMQLVKERAHSLVAFNWQHERLALCELADTYGITYAYIDGTVSASDRNKIVQQFQKKELQVLFCHPQATSHGLTLTSAATTIWCTPTYSSEQFLQFNRRIYRIGQTQRTEVICIAARDTKEIDVYAKLQDKISRSEDLLDVLVA
jgi:hypothetical protein